MKVLKMLHLDGAIIKDMSTFRGVNKGPLVVGHTVCDDLQSDQ
jgi:hypothetical protein